MTNVRREPQHSHEWKRGLRGVTSDVRSCKACGIDTNTIFKAGSGATILYTCSINCADRVESANSCK